MSLCRSCGADVLWATTVVTGKAIPLDADPVDDGNVVIRNGSAHVLSKNNPVRSDETRYRAHWATCPNAKEHRRR